MYSPAERVVFLNERIVVRHEQLARAVTILSRGSEKLERQGKTLRVVIIILGALSAAQGAIVAVFGASRLTVSLVFAAIGIAVAAVAGIETAFKFESRSSDLRVLAARCQSARFRHNSEWSYNIALADPEKALGAARDLLAVQDSTLADVQLEAARLGLNIADISRLRYLDDDVAARLLSDRADGDLLRDLPPKRRHIEPGPDQ